MATTWATIDPRVRSDRWANIVLGSDYSLPASRQAFDILQLFGSGLGKSKWVATHRWYCRPAHLSGFRTTWPIWCKPQPALSPAVGHDSLHASADFCPCMKPENTRARAYTRILTSGTAPSGFLDLSSMHAFHQFFFST